VRLLVASGALAALGVPACAAPGSGASVEPPAPTAVAAGTVPVAGTDASTRAVSPEDQTLLTELWKRRVVAPGVDRWTPEELRLERMREAEALGAVDTIRERTGTLLGYAVRHGSAYADSSLWLTRRGFDKYLFLVSQSARKYFETRGVEAKFVFQVRTTEGRRVFDPQGILTSSGIELYHKILRGGTVRWKDGAGRVMTNARPGPSSAPSPGGAPAQPPASGPPRR
jgi:hypothetical protein